VERGVPATQIESEGHGSERPIASNESEEGRARNRRVELVVVKS
jgi:OOP family OmpA-OmpF porin